jgi:hypothetical protein
MWGAQFLPHRTSTPPCDGDVPQVFGDTDDVIDVLDRIHVNIGMVVAQPAVGAASGACSCVQGSLICEGREFEFGDVNVIQFAGDGNGNCSELDDGVNLSRPGGVLRCCHDAPGCADRNDCCRPLPLPSGPFDPLVGVKINTAILNLHSGCAAMEVPVNVFPGAAGTVRTSFLVGPPPTTPTPTPTVVPSVATPTGSGPTPIGVPTFVNG